MKLTAHRHDLLLPLNDYRIYNGSSKRILSEQNVVVKALNASVKQREKRMSSLEDQEEVVRKTNAELMKTYPNERPRLDIL